MTLRVKLKSCVRLHAQTRVTSVTTAAGVYDVLVPHMSPSSSPACWKITSLFYIFMFSCLPHRSITYL